MRNANMQKALETWDGMAISGFVIEPCPPVQGTLSQILEVNAPEKYYLSRRAAEGILRRADRRNKELPKMLKDALEEVVELGV